MNNNASPILLTNKKQSIDSKLPITLAEYSDLISGLKWSDYLGRLKSNSGSERYSRVAELTKRIGASPQYLYDRNPQLLLEKLYLKLSLFLDISEIINDAYKYLKKPVNHVNSESFRITIALNSNQLPTYWSHRVELFNSNQLNVTNENNSIHANLYDLGWLLFRMMIVNDEKPDYLIKENIKVHIKVLNKIYKNNQNLKGQVLVDNFLEYLKKNIYLPRI